MSDGVYETGTSGRLPAVVISEGVSRESSIQVSGGAFFADKGTEKVTGRVGVCSREKRKATRKCSLLWTIERIYNEADHEHFTQSLVNKRGRILLSYPGHGYMFLPTPLYY